MGTLHNLNAPAQPVCPFSIKSTESVLAGETSVGAVPCLGPTCMAFTQVTNPDGSTSGDCRLCLVPQTINLVAQQIAVLTARLKSTPIPEEKLNG